MERCPRCDTVGTVHAGPTGVPGCTRCGWTLDGSQLAPAPRYIPLWKVLVPLVVPAVLLWSTAWWTRGGPPNLPAQQLSIGLTFFLTGLWAGANALVWERLPPSFRRHWRPPHVLTPIILAVVFCVMGGGQVLEAMKRLL